MSAVISPALQNLHHVDPWSSLELLGVHWSFLEFRSSSEFLGVPRSSSEFLGDPWSEFLGVPGSSSEFLGVPRTFLEFFRVFLEFLRVLWSSLELLKDSGVILCFVEEKLVALGLECLKPC